MATQLQQLIKKLNKNQHMAYLKYDGMLTNDDVLSLFETHYGKAEADNINRLRISRYKSLKEFMDYRQDAGLEVDEWLTVFPEITKYYKFEKDAKEFNDTLLKLNALLRWIRKDSEERFNEIRGILEYLNKTNHKINHKVLYTSFMDGLTDYRTNLVGEIDAYIK